MSDLIQKVVDGKIPENTAVSSTKEEEQTKGTTNLGKDAFLQLLVAEMQNQDPLEPTTNTEWISQLATFSQLEELQTLSSTTEKSQMFSLIGKNVIISTQDVNGNTTLKSGIVDFISTSGKEPKFSVNGSLYSMENLYSVVDSDYLYEKNKPSLDTAIDFTFDGDAPSDLQFDVNLGEDPAEATEVAVLYGEAVLSSDYVTLSGNTVTIKSDILQQFESGTYKFSLVFNDKNFTTVDDKLTITVFNSHPTVAETENEEEIIENVENEDPVSKLTDEDYDALSDMISAKLYDKLSVSGTQNAVAEEQTEENVSDKDVNVTETVTEPDTSSETGTETGAGTETNDDTTASPESGN
ncbi:MAG: hypothetical protein K6B75_06950 [Lachnospiraceae bacterium]|nr:hypothetical protein [Lachnospiraceae bacterium]